MAICRIENPCIINVHIYLYSLCVQVKRFLEHVNSQLPNLSKNLFILFNHWDQVADEDEDSDSDDSGDDTNRQDAAAATVKKQHLQKVREFLVQGLQANAVLDRTFFVSGKEACKVQENEKKGKPSSGIIHIIYWPGVYTTFHKLSLLHI